MARTAAIRLFDRYHVALTAASPMPKFVCASCNGRYFSREEEIEDHVRHGAHLPDVPNEKKLEKRDGLFRGIFPITESNKPQFYCSLCNVFLGTDDHCEQHFNGRGHKARIMELGLKPLPPATGALPPPTKGGLAAINKAIDELFNAKRMSEADVQLRSDIVTSLQTELRRNPTLHDCELKLFGSSRSGFGTATSDLDVVITRPDWDPARFLTSRNVMPYSTASAAAAVAAESTIGDQHDESVEEAGPAGTLAAAAVAMAEEVVQGTEERQAVVGEHAGGITPTFTTATTTTRATAAAAAFTDQVPAALAGVFEPEAERQAGGQTTTAQPHVFTQPPPHPHTRDAVCEGDGERESGEGQSQHALAGAVDKMQINP